MDEPLFTKSSIIPTDMKLYQSKRMAKNKVLLVFEKQVTMHIRKKLIKILDIPMTILKKWIPSKYYSLETFEKVINIHVSCFFGNLVILGMDKYLIYLDTK